MKKFLLVLFVSMAVSGCATDYSKNLGALSAYRQGQAERAAYDQAVLEQRAYLDGLNNSAPNISFFGAFGGRGSSVRGHVAYTNNPMLYGSPYGGWGWNRRCPIY